eukprot:m.254522 g.254522  ORF g.254522 m.254522 type:complete len:79 (+) comp40385_c0_seq26:2211-2447(+)
MGMVVIPEIMDIVCENVDDKKVEAFGRRLLNKSNAGVGNVISGKSSPYEMAYAILEAWYGRCHCGEIDQCVCSFQYWY